MYKITAKNRSGETYTLYDPRSPTLKVSNPNCKTNTNKAGLMTLTIPPKHPYINKISKLNTILYLWQDSVLIFSGRVLNDEFDLYNTRKIEVEGELAYLNDSIQPLAVYHDISVRDYLQTLLDIHNEQVEEDRRFVLGIVTVEDPNDSLYRQSNYENTMDAIADKLVDRLGGYLVIRYGEDGTRYLDYLKEYGNVNSQPITPRTNLLDLIHSVRGEDIATAIIPLGAKLEDTDDVGMATPRLTIESANDGKNYIYDEEAVKNFGWIRKVVIHDDITLIENLLKAGYADLEESKYLHGTIEADVVDLHLTDEEIERIKLGDMIPFEDPSTGAITYMLVSGINLPVDAPGSTVYTLGINYETMTDTIIEGNKQTSEQIFREIHETHERVNVVTQKLETYKVDVQKDVDSISASVTETQTQITTTTENIYNEISGVREESVTQEQLEEVKSTVLQLSSDNVEMRFTEVSNLIDEMGVTVEEKQRLLEQYIRFEGARIELGRSDSVITAVLENDRLSFLENGQEVAYISNLTLYVTDIHVLRRLRHGDADSGYYDEEIGETGTLDLIYTEA